MRLYLMRHGTAEERAADGGDRPERKLVARGCEQAALMGTLLRSLGRLDRVLASPYVRAVETAEAVLTAFGAAPKIVVLQALAPDSDVSAAVDAVLGKGHAERERVLAVGHEPLLSEIAAELIGDGHAAIELRKGGLLELDIISYRPPRADLLGLLRPRHLRT